MRCLAARPQRPLPALLAIALLLLPLFAGLAAGQAGTFRDPVTVQFAAVGNSSRGLVGVVGHASITLEERGAGQVFMDTYPLTEVDMQGSARLAVQVAASLAGVRVRDYNFYLVLRSGSEVIGGPSAGAILTVGTVAALKGWAVNGSIMMTGTVNPDGSIGPVGGIPEKAKAARDTGHVYLFLYPEGQEEVAVQTANGVARLNMTEYCDNVLGITCRSVATVEEAVRYMTGYDISIARPAGEVITPEFKALMKPLSETLVAQARAQLTEAEGLAASVPESANAAVREQMLAQLAISRNALAEAEAATLASRFYSTASLSFQANIAARTARNYAGLLLAEDPLALADEVVARAEANASSVMTTARDAQVGSQVSLEAVSAAQARATEAERRAASARASLDPRALDLANALGAAAYADARAETVTWWLDIAGRFPAQEGYGARLEEAAAQAIASSEQSVAYSSAILENVGASSGSMLGAAREKLEDARKDRDRGLHAAALSEALEANVRAGSALMVASSPGGSGATERMLERAREAAGSAILLARAAGAEPVLAVSYYELGEQWWSDQPDEAFNYFQLARTIAGVGDLLKGEPAAREARYVGEPFVPIPSWLFPGPYLVASFAFGLGIGVIAAALVLLPPRELRFGRKQTPPAEQAPVTLTPTALRPAQAEEPVEVAFPRE